MVRTHRLRLMFASLGSITSRRHDEELQRGVQLLSGNWSDHLVYWIGPRIGGIVAALLYDRILMDKQRA